MDNLHCRSFALRPFRERRIDERRGTANEGDKLVVNRVFVVSGFFQSNTYNVEQAVFITRVIFKLVRIRRILRFFLRFVKKSTAHC